MSFSVQRGIIIDVLSLYQWLRERESVALLTYPVMLSMRYGFDKPTLVISPLCNCHMDRIMHQGGYYLTLCDGGLPVIWHPMCILLPGREV